MQAQQAADVTVCRLGHAARWMPTIDRTHASVAKSRELRWCGAVLEPLLLLRRELQADELGSTLQGVNVDNVPLMDSLPMFGLLFDEMRIELKEGDKYIRAVAYEA